MKKVLVTALALVMALCLAACGAPQEAPAADPVKPDETASASAQAPEPGEFDFGDGAVVALIVKNTVDAFHATLNGASAEALDAAQAEGTIKSWQLYDGQTDPIKQMSLYEDARNNGANFVIMVPAEAEACAPIVQDCADNNIPCILFNSFTTNQELATAFVGSDDEVCGEMTAQYVVDQMPDGGGWVHLKGVTGNSAATLRGRGIKNTMDAGGNWELLAEADAEWQAEKAVNFITDWMTTYGDQITAVLCDNDDMSAAVQAYCNSIGREDILCMGADGNPGPLAMIKAGELKATISQPGVGQANAMAELMKKIITGEAYDKVTYVEYDLITIDNVDDYL